MATSHKLERRVYSFLEERIDEEFGCQIEVQYHENKLGRNGPRFPDISIIERTAGIPTTLQEEPNIEKFFPEDVFKAPIITVEVKNVINPRMAHDYTIRSNWGPPEDDEFPNRFLILKQSQQETLVDRPNSEYIINTSQSKGSLQFLTPIVDCLLDYESSERRAVDQMDEFVSSFRPKLFHFNEVLRGYDSGQRGAVVVLLSVFFESYCYQKLEHFAQTEAPNEAAGNFVDEDDRFEVMLKACRLLELIDEQEFSLINNIRHCRNKYAHDITGYDRTKNDMISKTRLEEAIQLYEELIGAKKSMIQ